MSILLLMLIAIAFYIHNFLSAEFHDDFNYKFVFFNGLPDYSNRICSMSDILKSQYDHYFTVNGRTVVHLFLQFFSGIMGKQVFNIFNVFLFMIFVIFLKHNITKTKGSECFIFAYAITVTLILMLPSFGMTFLWMSGSINYLWSSTGLLIFLMLYERFNETHPSYRLALISLPIFLLGWTHEAVVLPIALSIIALDVLQIKKRMRTTGFWMALAFFAGACMSAFAPSTIARAGVGGGLSTTDFAMKVVSGFIVLGKLKIIYIAITVVAILWFRNRMLLKSLVRENAYLLLATIPALGIVFVSGFDISRTAFGLELYCLIFLLRAIGQMIKTINVNTLNRIGISLIIVIGAFYGFVVYHAIPTWHETQSLISQIQKNQDGVIGTDEHDAGMFSSFICTMIDRDNTEYAMNYDSHNMWPASIAATYHRDSLVFLPLQFLQEFRMSPNKFEEFDMNSPYEFFIKRIGNAQIDSILWVLNPTDFSNIPFFFRPIAKKLGRYVDNFRECEHWAILYLKGERYLIVKKEHAWDARRKGILVIEKKRAKAIDDQYQRAA